MSQSALLVPKDNSDQVAERVADCNISGGMKAVPRVAKRPAVND